MRNVLNGIFGIFGIVIIDFVVINGFLQAAGTIAIATATVYKIIKEKKKNNV
ncbi:MAG TPA: hypothetical protein PLG30_14145 [Bacteroidia bacterium]|nr:hypothetical protein [Bacteroidia bacterium]